VGAGCSLPTANTRSLQIYQIGQIGGKFVVHPGFLFS